MQLDKIIRSSPLFFEVEDSEINFIMKQCKVREFAKDALIFQEGDPTKQLYLILDGQVLVHKKTANANIRIDEVETGEIFGVSVFSEEKHRNQNATALSNCYILELDYLILEKLYGKDPKLFGVLMLNITRLLAKHLAKSNNAMMDIAALSQQMASTSTSPENKANDKPLVYVIEDDDDARHVLVEYLKEFFEVHNFNGPLTAIDSIQAGTIPDLFVTDFMMPEMTGIEFTEYLREEKLDKPVVFVTGVNQYKMATQALNLGVFSLIEKPFTKEELVGKAKSALKEKFFVEFNTLLLSQYSTLFSSLAQILTSIDSKSFAANLRQLLQNNQAEYEKIMKQKKWLNLF